MVEFIILLFPDSQRAFPPLPDLKFIFPEHMLEQKVERKVMVVRV